MNRSWEFAIGLFGLALAIVAVTVWFPYDIAGSFMETTLTGRVQPGDAFYPTVLAVLLGLLGLIQMFSGLRKAGNRGATGLTLENLHYLLVLCALLGISALLCYGLAPWLAETLNGGRAYRLLRDTAPWKFLGFGLAAPALIWPMVVLSERRVSLRGAIFVAVFVTILLVVFGMALPDTFLPPNAEY